MHTRLRNVYIDALPLIHQRKSGIGLNLENTLNALLQIKEINERYTIYLVVPLGKAKYLRKYVQGHVRVKTIPIPARILEIFLRTGVMIPLDLLLGSGVYIFPNYRNWPLWRSRSITYIHDISFLKFPGMVQPKNRRYLSKYISRWASRADTVVTLSECVRQELERYLSVPYSKIQIVYCGVDGGEFYRRDLAEIKNIREKYSIPYEKYLLYIGNIEPRKNLVKLIEAYQLLPKKIRDRYGLLFVGGDGWLNSEFYSKLAQSQNKGMQLYKIQEYVVNEDLPALYSGATLLIHPALYEGFGITPLEAMACKTPVVVSDIPALREVVQDAALYFDPYNAASMASAIVATIKDEDDTGQRVVRGKDRATVLSWRATAEHLGDIINSEFEVGLHRHPIVTRLKRLYALADRNIRKMFGEKLLRPYRPQLFEDKEKLMDQIYRDFLIEQPTQLQEQALSMYLLAKHKLAASLKLLRRRIRGKMYGTESNN